MKELVMKMYIVLVMLFSVGSVKESDGQQPLQAPANKSVKPWNLDLEHQVTEGFTEIFKGLQAKYRHPPNSKRVRGLVRNQKTN
ncbi:hypothetical protein [Marinoscillum sp.]|uniref:hypothetical protein n=1 Tax=Marinoscillum sp. TaxID=2024838 RepID=UPI003BAA6BCA